MITADLAKHGSEQGTHHAGKFFLLCGGLVFILTFGAFALSRLPIDGGFQAALTVLWYAAPVISVGAAFLAYYYLELPCSWSHFFLGTFISLSVWVVSSAFFGVLIFTEGFLNGTLLHGTQ